MGVEILAPDAKRPSTSLRVAYPPPAGPIYPYTHIPIYMGVEILAPGAKIPSTRYQTSRNVHKVHSWGNSGQARWCTSPKGAD